MTLQSQQGRRNTCIPCRVLCTLQGLRSPFLLQVLLEAVRNWMPLAKAVLDPVPPDAGNRQFVKNYFAPLCPQSVKIHENWKLWQLDSEICWNSVKCSWNSSKISWRSIRKTMILIKILRNFSKNLEIVDDISLNFWFQGGAKECKSCRSRKMLKNAPTLAIRSVDTAENEASKVSLK